MRYTNIKFMLIYTKLDVPTLNTCIKEAKFKKLHAVNVWSK